MATTTVNYAAQTSITITLASLASSSTRTSGRESTVVDNSTNKYVGAIVSGKIRTGTSPTVSKQIDVWVYGQRNDTPTYPAGLTGSDANASIASENVRNAAMRCAQSILVDATSDRDYDIAPFDVAAVLGYMPKRWGIFIAHDTGVNLNATGGNFELQYVGYKYDVA